MNSEGPSQLKIEQDTDFYTEFAAVSKVRVETSSRCFPREFVSFVRPRELASFDP